MLNSKSPSFFCSAGWSVDKSFDGKHEVESGLGEANISQTFQER